MTQDDKGRPSSLKDAFGNTVELSGEGGAPETYRILAELEVDGTPYAILQSDAMVKESEIEVFRVAAGEDGSLHLETVDDDEQWEKAAEAYDDLQFGSDERP